MDKQKVVMINGRAYDSVTGLPVEVKREKTVPHRTTRSTSEVHKPLQRSQTLNRRMAHKSSSSVPKRPVSGRTMDIARNSQIAKFASHPQTPVHHKKEEVIADKPATPHPMAHRALKRHNHAHTPAPIKTSPVTAKEVKEHIVAAALANAKPNHKAQPGFFRRHSRKVTVGIIVLAVILAGSYLTVTNLPVLSVAFAASQSGIKASYPGYTPDGYHLQQPITYSDGKVELEFVSNTGAGHYIIKQSRSSWDSSAVLTNIVQKTAGDDYIITQDSGLTIYTYRGNAAWVNGGILYVIENSAPLADQIRTIATSL